MNCEADMLATSFRERMDRKEVMSIQERFFTPSSKVCLPVKGKRVSSNFQHSIHWHIQEWKHGWDNAMWSSINWATMKGSYLSLGPLQWIKTSKCVHGWLNTGQQKSKYSQCRRCSQAPTRPRSRWDPRTHTFMPSRKCTPQMIQTCIFYVQGYDMKLNLQSPTTVHLVHQVMARISGNTSTGC
jgi:hypothetical protein